jgi:hypothetical protein
MQHKHNISRKRSYSPQSSTPLIAANPKPDTTAEEELTPKQVAEREGRHINTIIGTPHSWLTPKKNKPYLRCTCKGGRIVVTPSQITAFYAECTASKFAKKSKKRGAK